MFLFCLVVRLRSAIAAPGIPAPAASRTVPTRVPVVAESCARTLEGTKNSESTITVRPRLLDKDRTLKESPLPAHFALMTFRLLHSSDLPRISQFNLSFTVIVNKLPGNNNLLAVQHLYIWEFRKIGVSEYGC